MGGTLAWDRVWSVVTEPTWHKGKGNPPVAASRPSAALFFPKAHHAPARNLSICGALTSRRYTPPL